MFLIMKTSEFEMIEIKFECNGNFSTKLLQIFKVLTTNIVYV